jgi:hypothetical protein
MHRICEKRPWCCIESHTWDQGPFYLSIQHHGLFSPIPCMRPVTTLSVYTTSALVTNPIHEKRDHSICLYNTMVSSYQSLPGLMHWICEKRPWCCIDRHSGPCSHVCDWWEETMVLYRQMTTLSVYTTSSLLTNPIHENSDHSICIYNTMVSSHQCHTWEKGPLYLVHGLMNRVGEKRPWGCIDR